MPGTLFVVATPIGNLEDITARALRVLREATLIAAEDTRRTAHLLARYAIGTPTTSLHEHNEVSKSAALVARLARGESIALVSDAGTPTVSDPGARLIRAAIDAGVRVESVPGPSAALTALAASGLPSDTFLFLGFPPIRSKARTEWLGAVETAGRTVVFFEAPHRIRQTLSDIRGRLGDVTIVVARELTKIHEELVRGPISSALDRLETPRGEFTVVVGVGHKTQNSRAHSVDPPSMLNEFCHLTEIEGLKRQAAIAKLASRHGLPRNEVYAAIEKAKNMSYDQY
jgi:16S rRNA (cytidine1402-2'-O)-methyltransferase